MKNLKSQCKKHTAITGNLIYLVIDNHNESHLTEANSPGEALSKVPASQSVRLSTAKERQRMNPGYRETMRYKTFFLYTKEDQLVASVKKENIDEAEKGFKTLGLDNFDRDYYVSDQAPKITGDAQKSN